MSPLREGRARAQEFRPSERPRDRGSERLSVELIDQKLKRGGNDGWMEGKEPACRAERQPGFIWVMEVAWVFYLDYILAVI